METLLREFLRKIFVLAQIHSKVISGHPQNQKLRYSPKREITDKRKKF